VDDEIGERTTWTERGEAKGKGPCHMARWGIGGKEGNGARGDTTWKGPTGIKRRKAAGVWTACEPLIRTLQSQLSERCTPDSGPPPPLKGRKAGGGGGGVRNRLSRH
jgi:hypothetical protein